MDLRHIVTVDHANIRQLADQIMRSASASGPTGRDNLFDQLDNEVRRHLMLMTTVIMPAAGSATTSRDPHAGHDELERSLDDLATGQKDGAQWTTRFEHFSDELDRVFGEHTQLVAALASSSDADRIARDYERAKMRAIRSGGYVSRWRGNRKAITGIGFGLAAAAAVAAVLWRRRSRDNTDDVIPTQRRLNPPSAYGRPNTTATTTVASVH